MSRVSNLKLRGSKLKEYCLLNMYDEENKCKVSVGAFMHGAWKDIGGGCKSRGNVDHWFRHTEIVNSDPHKGEKITEELVYLYNVEKGIIDSSEIKLEDFTNNTQKIRNKVDDHTLMRHVEMEILGFTQSEALPYWTRKETLLIMCDKDEEQLEKIFGKCRKKLLER